MRRSFLLGLAAVAVLAGVASATENVVTKVTARADGAKTVIVVHGTATPSFTAYRLERPARVVVDVADGKLGTDELRAGPIDVDTWAVGQIAMVQYANDESRTARLMIGFKRPASYDIKAAGHDLVITVTANEPAPQQAVAAAPSAAAAAASAKTAEALRVDAAKLDEARKRRQEAEAQAAATEQRRQAAVQAEQSAVARATDAEREAEAASARALAAKQELDRVVAARQAEEQRLQQVRAQASTETAQSQADRDKLVRAEQAEQARLEALRGEAQALAKQRELEAKKLAETQAAARKAAEERQAHLVAVEEAARARQAATDAAQRAEERRAQARAEEAARLQQAADAAARARGDEERARVSESASREAENRATQAMARAQAAEAAARAEQARLAKMQSAAQTQADAAARAQAEVERARAELAKLAAAQEAERARVEAARREAAEVAAERAQAVERAQHAAALASGSLTKMAEAEREARRIADERAKESARLEAVKKEMQAAADARARELARLDQARTEAQKVEAARRAEEARLLALRDQVRQQSDALSKTSSQLQATSTRLQATSTQLQAANDELSRKHDELSKTSSELQQANDELSRKNDELSRKADQLSKTATELQQKAQAAAARDAEMARARDQLSKLAADEQAERARLEAARAQAARAQAELARLDAARKTADQQAQAQAQAAAQQTAAERARLDQERQALEAQLARERAALAKKLAAAQADVARVTAEQQKKQAELEQRQAELARVIAEQQAKEAERSQLDAQLKAARSELARLEAAARERLAMVPTPARMATAPRAHTKDVLPVDKLPARVRDVRFADDGDAEKVIVDVSGNARADVVRTDGGKAVLKIARADLPKKLERTLDASAFDGPIRSVSTYPDADDPGAVRVEVALADGQDHPAPRLTRDNGTLTWEFPRSGAGTRSLPPPKMAAYGASLPLQVAQATPRPGARRRVYTGKRIDLDFQNADIHPILKLISEVGNVSIVTSDDVKGQVTLRLRDVPWDQALDVILRSKGLGMVREGNIIRVAPQAVLEKEMEQEVARAKAAVELKPLDTRLIGLSYSDAAQILPRVTELLSPRGRASVDTRTNTLIVTDVASNIALAEDLVRNLDTQTPQVLIEARIVEARTTFLRDVGIQWGGNTINSVATGNPTGIVFPSTVGVAGGATDNLTNTQGLQLGQSGAVSPNFVVNMPAAVGTGSGGALGLTLGSLNGNVNINLRLSSLENTGNVRIISAPKIMTLDNIEAQIEQGVSIPISVVSAAGANTVFVDAKLNLTVKPHVTNEGSIIMNVLITRNEPDFVNVGARGDPTILKKQAKTEMLVRDGDTAVIGGIYTRNTGESFTKVPWFADIPILGWLFKNKRQNDDRTELLIFITPRIVNRAVVAR